MHKRITCAIAVHLLGLISASAQPVEGSAGPNPLATAALRWDINHDGVVTCDEWKAYATGLFNQADKNKDGYLDANDFGRSARWSRSWLTPTCPISMMIATIASAARNSSISPTCCSPAMTSITTAG